MRWTPLLSAPAFVISVPGQAAVYFTTEQAQQAMFPGATFSLVPLALSDADRSTMLDRSGVHEPFQADRMWRAPPGGVFRIAGGWGRAKGLKRAPATARGG